MVSLDYMKWDQRAKQARWKELREILTTPWNGDRGWEGRTIGLRLPLQVRNFAVSLQEKLGLRSMKEVLFKALVIGLRELDKLPEAAAEEPLTPPTLPPSNVVQMPDRKPAKKVQRRCERCDDPLADTDPGDRCFMCTPVAEMEAREAEDRSTPLPPAPLDPDDADDADLA